MMTTLTGYVWNCGGLTNSSSPLKSFYFEKNFGTNFDVSIFLETHHKTKIDLPPAFLRFESTHHLIHSPHKEDEPFSGIVCLIARQFKVLDTMHLIKGRLLHIEIQHTSTLERFHIFPVYLHTNNNLNKTSVKNFVQALRTRLEPQINPNTTVLLLGDFNFIDYALDKANGLNPTDRMVCKAWLPLLSEFDLVDPFRMQNPNKKVWSFIGSGKPKNSRIDRLYINSTESPNMTQMNYNQTPFGGHRILKFTKKGTTEHGKGYYKMNTSILKEPKHRELIETLAVEVSNLDSDPIRKWQTFTMLAKSRSMTYSKQRSLIKNKLKRKLLKDIANLEEHPNSLDAPHELELYNYLQRQLKKLELDEIEGYRKRLRLLAPYEKAEPDISFYAKLQKKKISSDTIGQLAPCKDGEIYSSKDKLLEISTNFYKNLYTPNKVDINTQNKLLKKIKKRISHGNTQDLNAQLTDEELFKAAFQLKQGTSPGLDGLPIEFYQEYWDLLQHLYLAFVRAIRNGSIPNSKNTSVIKLIYKNKGETFLLDNYRPISLMNVDIKIICKALANRLLKVLPTIIHTSQTAVFGRRIDQTVHLIRDLIDLANQEDETAAFLFLDQEKAFDRVNHDFLFKTMKTFGIPDNFIKWVQILYSNASAHINVNGFLTKPIPLNRGVRQGCPLSSLLYVMVIEVLALQLRDNPNIVGFQVGNEKFVSAHYMDDTTIIITQNRCFKEVIKELADYENASGAKINPQKTKGLWAGSWKGRRNTPLGIEWTSENVKNLGIYFGNKDPAYHTFNDRLPKFSNRLNYYKQFKLSSIGKSRTIEIFIASTLVYAIKFYPIPKALEKNLRTNIRNFMNFPHNVKTIAHKEMWRLKEHGGLKLVNVQVKSQISKAKWLIDLVSNPELSSHLLLFDRLLGYQKGNISGRHLLFLETSYLQKHLKTNSSVYKEGLLTLSHMDIQKGIANIDSWDDEHLFYNKHFTLKQDEEKTLSVTPHFERLGLFKFSQFLEEKAKARMNQVSDHRAVTLWDNVRINPHAGQDDILLTHNSTILKFPSIPHHVLYEDFISNIPGFHHSQLKWSEHLGLPLDWNDIWNTVHNPLNFCKTTSIIWHQLHLNFYTQYSYNKWHKVNMACPLCGKVPKSIFHIILDCDIVSTIWRDITPVLLKLHPGQPNDEEKAFGIVRRVPRPGVRVRNWLTFLIRRCISKMERRAHFCNSHILNRTKRKIQYSIEKEIDKKLFICRNDGNMKVFDEFFTHSNVICKKIQEQVYVVTKIFSAN